MSQVLHNIYGLSRSGNHAIIFWIIHNYVDSVKNIGKEIYIDENQTLCYLNNVNIYESILKNNFPLKHFNIAIKSYEDIEFNKNTTIIILRDFLNLLCSRYKKYSKNICFNEYYICDLLRLINVWKQHTYSPKKTIKYNNWLVSKEYRDKISEQIVGIFNRSDNINYMPDIGGGSSFEINDQQDAEQYISRYKQVKIPKYMIDYILSDKELLDLNKKIFSIDIEKILQ